MEKKVVKGLTVNINTNIDKLLEKLNDAIEHAEKENCFATNRIERRVKGHACD